MNSHRQSRWLTSELRRYSKVVGCRDRCRTADAQAPRLGGSRRLQSGRTAAARITVILHGDATLVALNDRAYAERFQANGNPNLPLFRKLRDAGVELLVCGQTLHHNGAKGSDVGATVDIAVSGLTVNVNRQQDGYAFIPLH